MVATGWQCFEQVARRGRKERSPKRAGGKGEGVVSFLKPGDGACASNPSTSFAKRIHWTPPFRMPKNSSVQPVFETQPRHLGKIHPIPGEQRRIVSDRNAGDLQVHCANADSFPLETTDQ